MKDRYLTKSRLHQGSDKDVFCHHYCSCWFWMGYCVELWMEKKRINLEPERFIGRYGICR